MRLSQYETFLYGQQKMSEIYGWITPKGEFEECAKFGHFESPSVLALWESEGYDDKLKGIKEDCENLINDNDHPEWHIYEMAKDDFLSELMDQLYELGYIRVGTQGMDMYFEYGNGCRVDDKLKACVHIACKAFADSKGCLPIFENVH